MEHQTTIRFPTRLLHIFFHYSLLHPILLEALGTGYPLYRSMKRSVVNVHQDSIATYIVAIDISVFVKLHCWFVRQMGLPHAQFNWVV